VPLKRIEGYAVTRRPNWITAGILRLAVLAAFVVAVGMVRPRLSPHDAGIVVAVGAAAATGGAVAFYVTSKRLIAHVPLIADATDAVLALIRRIGLPLLGLAFFVLWTFVYLALWAIHPDDTFRGLPNEPRFADFFYYAVSTAFVSPPGDIVAASRGARSATMIEMLTAFALLTAYLSSFVDWHERESTR
jgi:hypothetical protein